MKTFNSPKYFTFSELCVTNTGLNNMPVHFKEAFNVLVLGHVLDDIRVRFDGALVVNSAFRSEAVNKSVGGSSRSYHLLGLAADIRPVSVQSRLSAFDTALEAEESYIKDMEKLESVLLSMFNDGLFVELIPYGNFFHIALSDKLVNLTIEKMFNDK